VQPAAQLELTGIFKSFGSVQALRGVGFSLAPGEIHALLGENGAGKSTLLQVAHGMIRPERGVLRVGGRERVFHSPREARAAGIGMVHQHFTSIGTLTVGENIALATGRRALPLASRVPGELMEGLTPTARVETLSVVLRQRLEIVKALATGATTLLLDEPTAVLAPSEVDQLLELLRTFARGGGAVALVTHKLAEVLAAADRVTVLRNGVVTLSAAAPTPSAERLAAAMIGESLPRQAEPSVPAPEGADHPPASDVVRIGDITIHAGELVGVAAVEGNGQRELLRRIAGVGKPLSGAVVLALQGPVAFVPEDRATEGLIAEMSLTENLVLGLPADPRWSHGPRLDWPAARTHTAWLIRSFGIRAAGPDAPAATLSGGNQQKVILARALDAGPRVLVAENPTRGLDIRATAELHQRLREAARAGLAVIFYSTDLDEVLELGVRILVVRAGQVSEAPRHADRRVVGEMMLGLRQG
jgi:ABC-type uncharacterized transport system ATPase subunit